ncbi:uncharacterized protein LODBEIA_P17890 [Lodderomyces beijingensis]|uniref:N-glycosylation protein EOS1 n=1 Tax=Lodderomyces beijingensis TaxID=1775926 RepID=A0ABP0ZK41_9ASCO
MPISNSIRSRFGNNLESHQVDEDYTISSSRQASQRTNSETQLLLSSSQDQPRPVPEEPNYPGYTRGTIEAMDPLDQLDDYQDPVQLPTYELSQRLHSRSGSGETEETHANTEARSLGIHIYTPIPSLPIPRVTPMMQSNSSDSSMSPTPTYPHPHPSLNHTPELTSATGNNNNSNNTISSLATTSRANKLQQSSIKKLGLKFLNARQHFLLACCRDVSLIPPLFCLFQSWKRIHFDHENALANHKITTARGLEHFLTGVWCIVSAYLSYSILDSLLVRWIVTYSTSAAIVRVLSMSTIMITLELYFVNAFSAEGYKYGLHIWILISCLLTLTFIVQNFVTSNLSLEHYQQQQQQQQQQHHQHQDTFSAVRVGEHGHSSAGDVVREERKMRRKSIKPRRFFDFYNIVVFAVVPVGLASFITMIGLLRSLLILRIDVDQALTTVS